MKRTAWALVLGFFATALVAPAYTGYAGEGADDPETTKIINKYLTATQAPSNTLRGVSMEVEISASVPELQKHGKLHALQNISKLGQITYKVLGFQGDDTVKKDVIARYLSAEQQSQSDNRMAVTPANYKFKFKGEMTRNGRSVDILQITPRKKAIGLFKGELWVDAETGMPVREIGLFVKSPSVFLKKIAFIRDYEMQGSVSIPAHIESTVDTRIAGRAELEISFSNFTQSVDDEVASVEANP